MLELDAVRASKGHRLAASSMLANFQGVAHKTSAKAGYSKALVFVSVVLAIIWILSMGYMMAQSREDAPVNSAGSLQSSNFDGLIVRFRS